MGSYSRQTSTTETELFGTPPLDGWPESTCNPAGTPGIDQRQANQEKRIDKGIASGALNSAWAR